MELTPEKYHLCSILLHDSLGHGLRPDYWRSIEVERGLQGAIPEARQHHLKEDP